MKTEAERSLDEFPQMTLTNIARGAAAELFAEELAKVLANIQDPNTESSPKRKILLTFTFDPSKSRNEAVVSVDATSKLAPLAGAHQTIFVGNLRGKPVATIYTPDEQQELFDEASRPRAMSSAPAIPETKVAGS